MKTALLISGWPRFHAEFDEQLANLKGNNIEWIVVFWRNYPADVDLTLNACLTPSWLAEVDNEADAEKWLHERMPATHTLRHFSYVDWNAFPMEMVRDYPNQVPGTNPEAIFRQFWMFKQANLIRKTLDNYDLVFRTRADIGISKTIDFEQIHDQLINEPNRLVIPSNGRQGLNWADLFTIGLPGAIDIYADAVDLFNEFYQHGVTMHPENIVSHVLQYKGLYWQDDGYITSMRQRGRYLTPTFVRGKKYYEADFGRW